MQHRPKEPSRKSAQTARAAPGPPGHMGKQTPCPTAQKIKRAAGSHPQYGDVGNWQLPARGPGALPRFPWDCLPADRPIPSRVRRRRHLDLYQVPSRVGAAHYGYRRLLNPQSVAHHPLCRKWPKGHSYTSCCGQWSTGSSALLAGMTNPLSLGGVPNVMDEGPYLTVASDRAAKSKISLDFCGLGSPWRSGAVAYNTRALCYTTSPRRRALSRTAHRACDGGCFHTSHLSSVRAALHRNDNARPGRGGRLSVRMRC